MVRIAIGIVIGLAFVAAVVLVAFRHNQVECTVCLAYAGRQACETAGAQDESRARMQATSSVCAQLSGGVTDGIRCSNTPPISVECGP